MEIFTQLNDRNGKKYLRLLKKQNIALKIYVENNAIHIIKNNKIPKKRRKGI
ncbi:MAG: hypothetical protein QXS99_03685 [Thermoplasmata archaeon]